MYRTLSIAILRGVLALRMLWRLIFKLPFILLTSHFSHFASWNLAYFTSYSFELTDCGHWIGIWIVGWLGSFEIWSDSFAFVIPDALLWFVLLCSDLRFWKRMEECRSTMKTLTNGMNGRHDEWYDRLDWWAMGWTNESAYYFPRYEYFTFISGLHIFRHWIWQGNG